MTESTLDEKEITLEEAWDVLLAAEELSDVQFQCSDGIVVRSHRAMLSARSPVFRTLLYGNMMKDGIVSFRYSSNVMKAIFQYCMSNKTDRWDALDQGTALEMIDAANYFQLSEMKRLAERHFDKVIGKRPEVAMLLLERVHSEPLDSARNSIWRAMMQYPKQAIFSPECLERVDVSTLRLILAEKCIAATDRELFQLLQDWLKVHARDETEEVQALTDGFDLSKFGLSFSHEVMQPSGLFSTKTLMETFRAFALSRHCHSTHRPADHARNCVFWKTSGKASIRGPDSSPTHLPLTEFVHSGIVCWSIQVEKDLYGQNFYLGMRLESKEKNQTDTIQQQEGVWTYISSGCTVPKGATDIPRCNQQNTNIIRFALNLNLDNGKLTARFDGGSKEHLLFSNMKKSVKDDQDFRLVHFAQVSAGTTVTFLGFEPVCYPSSSNILDDMSGTEPSQKKQKTDD
jgi:BTB/POZ domain